MREFFPPIVSCIAIVLIGLLQLGLMRWLNPSFWRRRWVRQASRLLPLAGVALVALWAIGIYQDWGAVAKAASYGAAGAFVLAVALMVSLPISGLLHLTKWIATRSRPHDAPTDSNRRCFLQMTAAALPVTAVGLGVTGLGGAVRPIGIPKIDVPIAGLPPDLDGLTIWHLSDLHLGPYLELTDLEDVAARAGELSPDLVLVTGDIADDLGMLPPALELIAGVAPNLGMCASLGNHEYFRGVRAVRRAFGRSTVPLLVDEHLAFEIPSGTCLIVAGLDDPGRMGTAGPSFFEHAMDQALDGVPDDDVKIVMSHRPEAFTYAVERGIALTLAGHTHGGQIGWGGRSFLEGLAPEARLWGLYEEQGCHLYTSCGAGHWFPFRLGCPAEAPLIRLRAV